MELFYGKLLWGNPEGTLTMTRALKTAVRKPVDKSIFEC